MSASVDGRFTCRTEVVVPVKEAGGFYVVDVMVYDTTPLPASLHYIHPEETFVGYFAFTDKAVTWKCNLVTRPLSMSFPDALDDYLSEHFDSMKTSAKNAFREKHSRETFPGPDVFSPGGKTVASEAVGAVKDHAPLNT